MIENLLGNALKFTPEGGMICVGLTEEPGAHAMRVWVEDTGPGIPAELRELIFEKYAQAHTAVNRNGAGLGLAFCKLVVEAHSGTIGVEDGAQGGSRFWFRLPLAADAAR